MDHGIFQYYHFDMKSVSFSFSRTNVISEECLCFFDKNGIVEDIVVARRNRFLKCNFGRSVSNALSKG
jgi:hypothetical protein